MFSINFFYAPLERLYVLQNRFIYVPALHTVDRLCNALVDCLFDWNIDSTNDSMIEKIKDKLKFDTLIKKGSAYKMLDIAICYKDVFFMLKQREAQYTSLRTDM